MRKKSLLFICQLLILLILFAIISGCNAFNSQTADRSETAFNYNQDEETGENKEDAEKSNIDRNSYDETGKTEYISDVSGVIVGENVIAEEKIEEKEKENFKTANEEEKNEHEVSKEDSDLFIEIYYQDKEGLIIPVARRIPKQLSVAKSAMYGLIDSPMNRESMSYYGLIPILPKGTEFTINIKDKTAIIDFNNKILEYDNEKSEINIVSSIVYTLTQFDSIERVKILINGYEQEKLKFGTDISKELTRDDILINLKETGRINPSEGMIKWDIYLLKNVKGSGMSGNNGFVEINGDKLDYDRIFLVPVSVEFSNENLDTDSLVEMVMDFLSTYERDEEERLFSVIDESIIVNKSTIEGDLLTIDLSIDIENYGGSYNEYYLVNQILYSMKQIKGLKRIKILVDGNAVSLPEGTDFSHPILLPSIINNYIDEDEYY